MPDRIVRAKILTSDAVNALSWPAEVFYRRLMSVVDDYGRYDARPAILRGALYPLKIDKVSEADVVKWMGECSKAGLISTYQVDTKDYLEIRKFGQRLRAMRSQFPASDGPPVEDEEDYATKEHEGYVYLIGTGLNDETVKIGYSLNPWSRAKEISVGNHKELIVLMTFRGFKKDERQVHQQLKDHKGKNEWFSLPLKLIDTLNSCCLSQMTAKELIVFLRSSYEKIVVPTVPPEEKGREVESDLEKKGREVMHSLAHCKLLALRDPRWVKANKTNEKELDDFNLLLERRAHYEKNPADYKSHFANWKMGGKKEADVKQNDQPKSTGRTYEKLN